MNICCQSLSVWKGSMPIKAPAQNSKVSFDPPSPSPVTPMSVSTVTIVVLWFIRRLMPGGS